jgi:hypothetical protein
VVFLPFFIFALQQAALQVQPPDGLQAPLQVQTPPLQQPALQAQAADLQQARAALPVFVDVVA